MREDCYESIPELAQILRERNPSLATLEQELDGLEIAGTNALMKNLLDKEKLHVIENRKSLRRNSGKQHKPVHLWSAWTR